MTKDPASPWADYTYGAGNPVTFVDPSGCVESPVVEGSEWENPDWQTDMMDYLTVTTDPETAILLALFLIGLVIFVPTVAGGGLGVVGGDIAMIEAGRAFASALKVAGWTGQGVNVLRWVRRDITGTQLVVEGFVYGLSNFLPTRPK